ncbi:MAG: hypothetical protein IJ252_13160 [Solobacterium sp.]|nr:hypothetical protein [Solobacterium sp.]
MFEKLKRFFVNHTASVQQMPSGHGINSGLSFRFSEKEKTFFLPLLLIAAVIPVTGVINILS